MAQRLTKKQIGNVMRQVERNPQGNERLKAGADLLGVGFEVDIDGGLLYRGTYYPDRAELVDELLIDLGNKQRSL